MFGSTEEVRKAQAAEAIGLKDIPAPNDEYTSTGNISSFFLFLGG